MQGLMGVAAVVCIGSVAYAQETDVHTLVAEANRAFADGDYATALKTYQATELTLPQSSELAYNRGVTSYMLGDYAGARDAFNRSLMTQDVGLEAKAKFNLGNVAYALALRQMSTPREAIDLLKTATVHYRDAIDLDPHDDDARANIELAQRMIRDLLEKLKQQREERQQRRDDQQERQQNGQDQQQQGEQQTGQESAGPEEQQREKPRQETDDRMTPQEVERLLQAVRDEERRRRNDLARRRPPRRIPVAKDW